MRRLKRQGTASADEMSCDGEILELGPSQAQSVQRKSWGVVGDGRARVDSEVATTAPSILKAAARHAGVVSRTGRRSELSLGVLGCRH